MSETKLRAEMQKIRTLRRPSLDQERRYKDLRHALNRLKRSKEK